MYRCSEQGAVEMFRRKELPAVLLIHGFGGNRSEVRPLAGHLRGLGCEVVSAIQILRRGKGPRKLVMVPEGSLVIGTMVMFVVQLISFRSRKL